MFQGTLNKLCNSSLDISQALKQSFPWARSSSVPLAATRAFVQGNPGRSGPKVPGHQSFVSLEAAEFGRAESGGDSLSALNLFCSCSMSLSMCH